MTARPSIAVHVGEELLAEVAAGEDAGLEVGLDVERVVDPGDVGVDRLERGQEVGLGQEHERGVVERRAQRGEVGGGAGDLGAGDDVGDRHPGVLRDAAADLVRARRCGGRPAPRSRARACGCRPAWSCSTRLTTCTSRWWARLPYRWEQRSWPPWRGWWISKVDSTTTFGAPTGRARSRATTMTGSSSVRSITGSGGGRPVDGESRTVATVEAHVMSSGAVAAGPAHLPGPGRARRRARPARRPSAAGVGSVTRPLTPCVMSSVGPPLSVQCTTGRAAGHGLDGDEPVVLVGRHERHRQRVGVEPGEVTVGHEAEELHPRVGAGPRAAGPRRGARCPR